MSLEKVSSILKEADKKGQGIIGFNAFNYESIAWLIEVAEEEQVPVILMLYPGMSNYMSFEAFAAAVKVQAAKVRVPIGLHLDHSKSFEEIVWAIKAGFTSVMVDASSMKFEENIRLTSKVVETAHAMDVDVEAELGFVGTASRLQDFSDKSLYTKPSEAKEFAARTGVDSLAIAIGSAHGNYVSTPKLDLELLKEINNAAEVNLVLHGGTGIPEDQIRKAFKLGINKMNVGTEYFQNFFRYSKEIIESKRSKENFLDFLTLLRLDVKEYLRNKLKLSEPQL